MGGQVGEESNKELVVLVLAVVPNTVNCNYPCFLSLSFLLISLLSFSRIIQNTGASGMHSSLQKMT